MCQAIATICTSYSFTNLISWFIYNQIIFTMCLSICYKSIIWTSTNKIINTVLNIFLIIALLLISTFIWWTNNNSTTCVRLAECLGIILKTIICITTWSKIIKTILIINTVVRYWARLILTLLISGFIN